MKYHEVNAPGNNYLDDLVLLFLQQSRWMLGILYKNAISLSADES